MSGVMPVYAPHPKFTPPKDEAVIWRYMNLAYFVSMLDKQSLFFCRADRLPDPFEGWLPNVQYERMYEGEPEPLRSTNIASHRGANDFMKQRILVNCWHMNSTESFGMWKTYTSATEAVAIRTTYGRLRKALSESPPEIVVHIGLVEYVDHCADRLALDNALTPYLYKRRCYQSESELRAVIWHPTINNEPVPASCCEINDVGIHVSVPLATLIEEIVASPSTAAWFLDLLKSLLRSFGLPEIPVKRSILGEQPTA